MTRILKIETCDRCPYAVGSRTEPLAVLQWKDLLALIEAKDQAVEEWHYWNRKYLALNGEDEG